MNNQIIKPGQFRIRITQSLESVWDVGVRIAIFGENNTVRYAMPIQMSEVIDRDTHDFLVNPVPPMLSVDKSAPFLQEMMDQLWDLGIRPSDIGTPGHLAATQQHLNDMRAIVQKTLEVSLPDKK